MSVSLLAVNKVAELFEDVSKFVKSWSTLTNAIVFAVLASISFYCLGRFLKENKGESGKFKSLGTLFLLIISLGLIFLIVACLNY